MGTQPRHLLVVSLDADNFLSVTKTWAGEKEEYIYLYLYSFQGRAEQVGPSGPACDARPVSLRHVSAKEGRSR